MSTQPTLFEMPAVEAAPVLEPVLPDDELVPVTIWITRHDDRILTRRGMRHEHGKSGLGRDRLHYELNRKHHRKAI